MLDKPKAPINKVIAKFYQHDKILLIIHENPDGDTLASATALFSALMQIGKTAEMVCRDSIPKPFLFLDHIKEIQHDLLFGDFDLIIVIDCGDLNRTGFPDRLKKYARSKKKTIINIDHHPKNDLHKLAQFNLVDYHASSTSEIIYDLISQMNLIIDKNIATALLAGLYTDTGGFKHANTTSKTLQIAGDLMRSGGRIKLITQNIALNKTVSAMKLWGMVLHRLHRNHLGIVSSVVTREDLKKCEATDDDLAGVVNLINSIPGTKAAILFYETTDQKIRASIRTENEHVDVSRLAHIFGGGGHKRAAGFTIDGKLKINGAKWQIVLK